MTTATTESEAPARQRGPRVWKDNSPTARERVLCESLAEKVKELTGHEFTAEQARAFRFSYSRWYESPETRDLMKNMGPQLKQAEIAQKREKLEAQLRELENAHNEANDDADQEEQDAVVPDDEDTDDDDMFEDGKVSASF